MTIQEFKDKLNLKLYQNQYGRITPLDIKELFIDLADIIKDLGEAPQYLEILLDNELSKRVIHNFGFFPNVRVLDENEIELGVTIDHIDENSFDMFSNFAITGKIICSIN